MDACTGPLDPAPPARPTRPALRPISPAAVVAIFACTLVPILAGVYLALPLLVRNGVPFFVGYLICFQVLPFAFVLWLALHLYRTDGYRLTWKTFTRRMRLRLDTRVAVAGLGFLVFALGTYLALQPISRRLAAHPWLAPPAWFGPDLHPLKSGSPGTFMGMPVHGLVWAPLLYLVGWFLNVVGEELLLRGYLPPRMELRLGRKAWLVNAACHWGWHVCWRWQLVALVPIVFLLPLVAEKTRSTVPGLIAHGVMNLIGVVLVTLGALGLR